MSKKYILMERSWQYNDEYYYQPEDGGGKPVKIFNSKELADAERDKLNKKQAGFIEEIRDGLMYAEGIDDNDEERINQIDADIYEVVEVESED